MRDVEVIREDLANAKSGPAKGNLRVELIDAQQAEIERLKAEIERLKASNGFSPPVATVAAESNKNPFDSEEWKFIQGAITEIQIQHTGNQQMLFEKLWTNLMYKVRVWRSIREVIEEIGVGGEYPKNPAAMGRTNTTGRKLDEKPAPPPAPEAPDPEPPSPGSIAVPAGTQSVGVAAPGELSPEAVLGHPLDRSTIATGAPPPVPVG